MNYSYIKTVFPTFENTNSFNSTVFNELNAQIPTRPPLNVSGINNETYNNSNALETKDIRDKFYLPEPVLPEVKDVISEFNKIQVPTAYPTASVSNRKATPYVGQTIKKDNLRYYNEMINPKNFTMENFNSVPEITSTQVPVPVPVQTQTPVGTTASIASAPTPAPAQIPVAINAYNSELPLPKKEYKSENSNDPGLSSRDVCSSSYAHITECARCKEILYKNFNYEHKQNSYNEEIFELVSYCIFAVFILLLLEKLHK